MHGALGNALAVLVRQLFEQLVILQQQRPARAGGMEFWLSAIGAPAVVVRVFLPVVSCVMGLAPRVVRLRGQGNAGGLECKMIFPASGHKAN